MTLALVDHRYAHIIVIPFVAAALIYFDRQDIFQNKNYYVGGVIPLVVIGVLLYQIHGVTAPPSSQFYRLSVLTTYGILLILSNFLLSFGVAAFRRALFPLLLLFLMIPVPGQLMDSVIRILQEGSATVSAILFKLIGLPALRHNLGFSLPGLDIQITEPCSGIRSSIGLSILSLVAGHLLLRAIWRKLLLVSLTIPLVIFKNAVRIVTIASLGVYVSPDFLHGKLHDYGGLPFSVLELVIVTPLLIRWHGIEKRKQAIEQSGASLLFREDRSLGDR
jgi:exosortase